MLQGIKRIWKFFFVLISLIHINVYLVYAIDAQDLEKSCASIFLDQTFPRGISYYNQDQDQPKYKDSSEFLELKKIISELISFEENSENLGELKFFKSTPNLRYHLFTIVTDILINEKVFVPTWSPQRSYQSFDEFMFDIGEKSWFSETIDKVLKEINDRIIAYIRGYYEDEESGVLDGYGRNLSRMMSCFSSILTKRSDPAIHKISLFQDMVGFGVKKEELVYSPIDLVVGLYYWWDFVSNNMDEVSKHLLDLDSDSTDLSIKTIYNSYSKLNHVQKVALISYLIKDSQLSGAKSQGIAYLLGRYILSCSEDNFDKLMVQELMLNNHQFMNKVYMFALTLSRLESK